MQERSCIKSLYRQLIHLLSEFDDYAVYIYLKKDTLDRRWFLKEYIS